MKPDAWIREYLLASAFLHFVWEILQLPLYTLWTQADAGGIAFAVVHCTGGDILIAAGTLASAWALVRPRNWPGRFHLGMFGLTLALGVGYTVYSEWHNTVVLQSWAYTAQMPQLWGIGLSPMAQWLVVPSVVQLWLRYRSPA